MKNSLQKSTKLRMRPTTTQNKKGVGRRMIIVGDGAKKFAPLRHSFGRSENFLSEPTFEMIQWYYDSDSVCVLDYEPYDDRVSLVDILEYGNTFERRRTISIGLKEKAEICRNYLFYHPDERRLK